MLDKRHKPELIMPWIITGMVFLMLMAYIVVSHVLGEQFQQHWPEEQRIFIRTVLYGFAIVTFPITNLIRHVQLRLNETMAGEKTAKVRYFLTIMVSMVLIGSVGVLGFVMFLLGDGYNTLYIFTGLSMLGLFLYRPKYNEYIRIHDALVLKKKESDGSR
jgi:hypothetical protein